MQIGSPFSLYYPYLHHNWWKKCPFPLSLSPPPPPFYTDASKLIHWMHPNARKCIVFVTVSPKLDFFVIFSICLSCSPFTTISHISINHTKSSNRLFVSIFNQEMLGLKEYFIFGIKHNLHWQLVRNVRCLRMFALFCRPFRLALSSRLSANVYGLYVCVRLSCTTLGVVVDDDVMCVALAKYSAECNIPSTCTHEKENSLVNQSSKKLKCSTTTTTIMPKRSQQTHIKSYANCQSSG